MLLCLALLAGCSEDDEQPDPQLPPLVWPDDVATAIPDEGFREYCLERYDRDKDGRLSKDEVLAVKNISAILRILLGSTVVRKRSICVTTPGCKRFHVCIIRI